MAKKNVTAEEFRAFLTAAEDVRHGATGMEKALTSMRMDDLTDPGSAARDLVSLARTVLELSQQLFVREQIQKTRGDIAKMKQS